MTRHQDDAEQLDSSAGAARLTGDEHELLRRFRRLPPALRGGLLDIATGWMDSGSSPPMVVAAEPESPPDADPHTLTEWAKSRRMKQAQAAVLSLEDAAAEKQQQAIRQPGYLVAGVRPIRPEPKKRKKRKKRIGQVRNVLPAAVEV